MITIAICTWNRAASLARALASVAALETKPGSFEVLVVNNNSTDHTETVLQSFIDRLPLRWVTEPQQGIAFARNRVLDEARGDYILWLDDDMTVMTDWHREYQKAFQQYPHAGLFGGRIMSALEPDVTPARRQIVLENHSVLVPITGDLDFGADTRPLKTGEVFFSGNMALKTEIARRYRFNSRFGRVGSTGLMGGEETLFLQRMIADGVSGVWVGWARANHFIDAARLTPESIWKYFNAVGRTQARIDGIPSCPTLFGRPRWVVLQYWRECLKSRRRRIFGGKWLPGYLTAAKLAGYLEECDAHRDQRSSGYLVPPYTPDA